MIDAFSSYFDQTRPAFAQDRLFARAEALAMSTLVGLGRKTVSGMLCAGGQQYQDWSAAYRIFENETWDVKAMFAPARRAVVSHRSSQGPMVAFMDDTVVRKRGRKIDGTGWKRDPLGPPFHTNLVWSQRFLQVSMAMPESGTPCRARAIPVDFVHSPVPVKPKKKASEEEWAQYRQQQEILRISSVGVRTMSDLRSTLDTEGQASRPLWVAVDGSFTNRTVFRSLPDNTGVIGRIRKDAKLYRPPHAEQKAGRGRKPWYGEILPTPEAIRQDEKIPWQTVKVWAAGQDHDFNVKTINAVRWAGAGHRDLRLVIIRPLAYCLTQGARPLYRQPAYLVCTDPQLPLEQLIQFYVWRWEIELNFRDEKTLLGVGEAQVRTPTAVKTVPAMIVASYAMLLLAFHDTTDHNDMLPSPKWRKNKREHRTSTQEIINTLRTQLWGKALGLNKTHFVSPDCPNTNPLKFPNPLQSAVCYALH